MDSFANNYVAGFINSLSEKYSEKAPLMSKLDFGQYGDHKTIRPYRTIEEGVLWYASQPEIKGLPEMILIPLVAHNFNISIEEALSEITNLN
jgi:hypothetical protein